MATTKKTSTAAKERTTSATGWTDEERAAMQEHARELKKAKKGGGNGLADVLEKIAAMPADDRRIAERIHAIVTEAAPELTPRTWYGMPAYAKDGKVLCFFTPGSKFKERYSSFGFQPVANLDDGNVWPTSFAVTKLTKADEQRIAEMVKQAVS